MLTGYALGGLQNLTLSLRSLIRGKTPRLAFTAFCGGGLFLYHVNYKDRPQLTFSLRYDFHLKPRTGRERQLIPGLFCRIVIDFCTIIACCPGKTASRAIKKAQFRMIEELSFFRSDERFS